VKASRPIGCQPSWSLPKLANNTPKGSAY